MGFPAETIQRGEMDLKRALDDGQPLAKGKLDRRQGQRGWAPQNTKQKKGPPESLAWHPGKKEIKPWQANEHSLDCSRMLVPFDPFEG